MFQQDLTAVGGSLTLSALAGAVPILVLFLMLGVLRITAWISGLVSLAVAVVIATLLFGMGIVTALDAAVLGGIFGFFPILWIVVNAVWVHNLTVSTGSFDVLRRSFEKVSPDQRVQAIIIAFCFGALLEALAGFGTPVAISTVMLMSLGFRPMKAAVVALVANTAPVAFGALAIPVVTLGGIVSGVSSDPRLSSDAAVGTLGAMVGRQTPLLALVVPLALVFIVDGRRGLRQTWSVALISGFVFAVAQFVTANYISVPLTDIVAALLSVGAVVLYTRVWSPSEVLTSEMVQAEEAEETEQVTSGSRSRGRPSGVATSVSAATDTGGSGDVAHHDSRADVLRAYSPYLVIIAIFSVANIPAVLETLAEAPWTYSFAWPGLDITNPSGDPVVTEFKFNWFPAAGTLLILSGLISMAILKVKPREALRTYGATYVELRAAIVTVMAVLALAYVMNLSGQTTSLGFWLAGTGSAFAVLSPILGWLGVAVTGSDTSSNSLFGALQVQAASKAGLDQVLMASANSSGGVLGKMVSPQNLAIAAGAVGMAGREGDLFRKVIGWSLVMLVLMCIIVGLQATPVLGWMVPGS